MTSSVPCLLALATTLCAVALPAAAQRAVIVVRHAELAGGQMASPASTGLSAAGEDRAGRLARMLASAGVNAIYTTDQARTQLTAKPVEDLLGVRATVVPKADSAQLPARIRQEQPAGVVLVVGHSDTVPSLVRSYAASADAAIDPADFGSVFMVTPAAEGQGTVVRLRY